VKQASATIKRNCLVMFPGMKYLDNYR